ncbi:anthranilate synthase component I [Pelotomaculum propionicicum]|uniref:Anthranilate synthase component 1 n=1 Tax=Pelotomaculum propionicicum TaxID=258475 RepID=A0A4Y7RS14_9FIRM|nr:anthranilate synthase component I [Pelotomaculum propionicicum]TEB11814.1 Anthranilate synthase component 1 [Pelotomaculum propionicicum]
MITPGRAEYLDLAGAYNLIPVSCEINADLDTPTSIYKKIAPKSPAYLLESVEGGENLARYSFIGFDPFLTFVSRGSGSLVEQEGRQETCAGMPLDNLEQIVSSFKVYLKPGLPRFFGGAVGYIGYDLVRFIEDIEMQPGEGIPGIPECCFIFAGTVLIFDHVRQALNIVVNSRPGAEPASSYDRAVEQIEKVIGALKNNIILEHERKERAEAGGAAEANMTRAEFMAKVRRAKEYIAAGDILQVVLSRRLRVPFTGEPFNVYRRLRALNPSPYLFYLDFGELVVVGSSPEMLVKVEDGAVETCPIAGTRPRGKDLTADENLAGDLLADEKEKAEHLMLVDLGRNDLGRVCETGSVRVKRFMEVEKYSHVMHLVSNVRGRLAQGRSCFDALKSCFPAGTLSGAPKVRAMEIIGELEPDRRGVYGGAIGYLGFSGNLDTAIAIRTVLFHAGNAYVQAGAGIVADSDPAREYEETMSKARVLLKTLEEAK